MNSRAGSQRRADIDKSNNNDGLFVRLYIDAFRSGLVSALGPELWTTLQAIAIHMDDQGRCFPSQATLARLLGVERTTVNQRIKKLCDFRWDGQPVLYKEDQKAAKQGFACRYQVLPASGLRIFGHQAMKTSPNN